MDTGTRCKYLVHVIKMDVLHTAGIRYYYIDMELCKLDLRKFIDSEESRFGVEGNIWKIMLQIANGVQFVHSRGVIIRDLKPSRGNQSYSSSKLFRVVLMISSFVFQDAS